MWASDDYPRDSRLLPGSEFLQDLKSDARDAGRRYCSRNLKGHYEKHREQASWTMH